MCGIAGLVAEPGVDVDAAWLTTAAAALAHRGPDDRGYLQWAPGGAVRSGRQPDGARAIVAMAHRRLSILDLSDTGWQPMSTPDGRYHLLFNGEIYNYVELRSDLEATGRRFHSTGDTEVLLAAWAAWGPQCLPRLVGMFAFAVLDTEAQRLLLARDPFGIKPLFFAEAGGRLAFASEIAPLLALPGISRRAAPGPVYDYLRHGVIDHDGSSLFADIRRFPPAHYAEIDLRSPTGLEPRRYWRLAPDAHLDLSRAQGASRLRELFLESVRLHLRSDVKVGTALSGGIDSSAIVLAMREVGGSALDIRTFSWVADAPEIDEERWVDLVVDEAGAVAAKVRAAASDLVADLDRLIEVQGEPFLSTSIYAQYRVFGLAAAAGVKVMLDGQGADELLGGYRGHLAARAAGLARRGRALAAVRLLARGGRLPGAIGTRGLAARAGARLLPDPFHGVARRLVGEELVPAWLNGDWFAERGVAARPVRTSTGPAVLRSTLIEDLARTSLPALLRYEDRNSMAWSIESRVPFLTTALAEFVLALPEEHIVDDRATSKAVFRDAMRGIVPDAVLDRRDKIGFATPERTWMTSMAPWVKEVLGSEEARSVTPLRLGRERLLAEGRGEGGGWRAVNLVRWSERFGVEW